MASAIVQRIADQIQQQLTRRDLINLFSILRSILYPQTADQGQFVEDLREAQFSAGVICPHCSTTGAIRFGKFKGRQRYRCKACRKTFSDFTRSPLYRSHYPEKWLSYAECMLKGMCLRATADEIGVTLPTAFYWRHKILKALRKLDLSSFEGITECDETFFLYSEKGQRHITGRKPRRRGGVASKRGLSHEQVCVLVAYDRSGDQTLSKVACTGMISRNPIDQIIGPFVTPTTVLCTDAARGYRPYCKAKGIQHVQLAKGQRKHGIYHVQNVNSYHSALKKWIMRFNGVASKYLDGYLAWFWFAAKKAVVALSAKMKDMIIEACVKGLETSVTWDSIRLSKFAVAA